MDETSDYETARITIVRYLTDDGGDAYTVTAHRPDGEALPFIEALGLLEAAKLDLAAPSIRDDPDEQEEG